nr:MAG TPA: Transcription factor HY5 leucine zipper, TRANSCRIPTION.0A [Caudoviricetes sp.]
MKIIDENGSVVENPDLTAGYLAADTEAVEHPAQDAVEELSHYETVAEYPNGGKDVRKVIDVPGVPAQAAWTEQVPVQRYIRYTAEELARREKEQQEARQQQEALDKLPQTLEALQKENEMLRQCLLEMSETVYA